MKRIPILDDNTLPFSRALSYVMENYEMCISRGTSEFCVYQLPFIEDVPLFLTTLMAVGVFQFLTTAKSTELIAILHEFNRLNWEIVGLDTVVENSFGGMKYYQIINGIRVRYKHADSFVNCPENWNAIGARIESYQEM